MQTILLSDKAPFAGGTERRCYVHPAEPDKCLKVINRETVEYRRTRHVYRRLIPVRFYDANIADYKTDLYLRSLGGADAYKHIPRCYGFVKTDLGDALCVQLMRGADGGIAPPLTERVRHGADAALKAAMEEYLDFLLNSYFSRHAAFPYNILSVKLSCGSERFYMGECRRIRKSQTAPFFSRTKMQNSVRKLREWFESECAR